MNIISGVLLILCLLVQTELNLKMRDSAKVELPSQAENAHRWDPRLFKMLTFGHLYSAIDWMWIQVLLDPNVSHVPKGEHPKVYYALDLITDLDPINFASYRAGSNLLAVVRDDGDGARNILEKGESFRMHQLASLPERVRKDYWEYSWGIPLLLGYVYLFELQDMPHAAIAFQNAAVIPGAPGYLQQIKKRLESPGGEYEVGLRLLNFMIESEKNESGKEELLKKRSSLFVGQYLFEMNRTFENYVQLHPNTSISIRGRFDAFLRKSKNSHVDPWGGTLSVSDAGRIQTTTPHQKVFGLD